MIPIDKLKTVIVVRKDLELPTGKWIAQAVHAAMRAANQRALIQMKMSDLYDHLHTPVCIVCYVKNEGQLLKLYEKVKAAGIAHGLQRDAGHNFVEPNTPTVLCIGPDEEAKMEPFTKKLQLLK
jgi:PTH2 family peptidyl-tRNA hydrolase